MWPVLLLVAPLSLSPRSDVGGSSPLGVAVFGSRVTSLEGDTVGPGCCVASCVLGMARRADAGRGGRGQAGVSRRFDGEDEVLPLLQRSWSQAGALLNWRRCEKAALFV